MSNPAHGGGSRKKLSRSKHGTLHELNITPLLDLVMVLLVIFMITTPQLSNDLKLNLPSDVKPPEGKKPQLNYIDVSQTGDIEVNGRAITIKELPGFFAAIKKTQPDPPFVIRGNDQVHYEKVIAIMDLLQQSDINKVGLAAQ